RRVRRHGSLQHTFVMIVHRHRKCLLGDLLSDYILIQSFPNLCRFRHSNIRRLTSGVFVELLIENAFANVDAAVANINTRACDELAYLSVAFATEGAHGEVRSARHMLWIPRYPFRDNTASGISTSLPSGGDFPSSNFTSFRDLITSSTNPY